MNLEEKVYLFAKECPISPLNVARKFKLTHQKAKEICQKIWIRLHNEARELARKIEN